jgi:ketosteroid isomerase-like protein
MKDDINSLVEQQVIAVWNTQNAEKVVAAYTEDLIYKDPNVETEIKGRRDMYRYMSNLYAMWDLHLTLKSVHPLQNVKGAAVLWEGTFKRGGKVGQISGMELVIFDGDLVKHNEVFFDRMALAGLLT